MLLFLAPAVVGVVGFVLLRVGGPLGKCSAVAQAVVVVLVLWPGWLWQLALLLVALVQQPLSVGAPRRFVVRIVLLIPPLQVFGALLLLASPGT